MKVAIVGGNTKLKAPVLAYGRDWEIWGLNAIRPRWTDGLRWSRWFNLHRWAHLVRDWSVRLREEIDWAQANPAIPFYVVDRWRRGALPQEVIFPREALAKQPRGNYHAGSFDWLVAFAVHLKATEIALHGIGLNMESGEPLSARACLEYWCGYAAGRGIKVHVAADCDIFHQYHLVKSDTVYGYDDVELVEDRT